MISIVALVFAAATGMNDPYPIDDALTARANAQAVSYGLQYRVIVAVPPSWRDRGIVNAKTHVRGNVLAITISPILLEEMDAEGLTGMFAHELAHPRSTCGLRNYRSWSEEVVCEHAADVQAARWVGKRAVLRGLCQVMASGWNWRYNTDVSPLIERIRLLHNRKDIP
jgi:predicted Zn-dependent protease